MSSAVASRLTLRRCRVASSLSHLSTRSYHGSSSLLYTDQDPAFDGVSPEMSKLIYHHAHQPQTAVSLQALMRTGRGEFLHKTYKEAIIDKEDDGKVATEQVLMQVCALEFFPLFFTGIHLWLSSSVISEGLLLHVLLYLMANWAGSLE